MEDGNQALLNVYFSPSILLKPSGKMAAAARYFFFFFVFFIKRGRHSASNNQPRFLARSLACAPPPPWSPSCCFYLSFLPACTYVRTYVRTHTSSIVTCRASLLHISTWYSIQQIRVKQVVLLHARYSPVFQNLIWDDDNDRDCDITSYGLPLPLLSWSSYT